MRTRRSVARLGPRPLETLAARRVAHSAPASATTAAGAVRRLSTAQTLRSVVRQAPSQWEHRVTAVRLLAPGLFAHRTVIPISLLISDVAARRRSTALPLDNAVPPTLSPPARAESAAPTPAGLTRSAHPTATRNWRQLFSAAVRRVVTLLTRRSAALPAHPLLALRASAALLHLLAAPGRSVVATAILILVASSRDVACRLAFLLPIPAARLVYRSRPARTLPAVLPPLTTWCALRTVTTTRIGQVTNAAARSPATAHLPSSAALLTL